MDISQSVALWLRNMGHDAVHLNDENLFKLEDNDILAKAIKEKRVILTTDMDFSQLLALDKFNLYQLFNSELLPILH